MYLRLLVFLQQFLFQLVLLPLCHFASLPFTAICKACSGNYFAFLHFFLLGMVLITASYTHKPLFIVLQALCVSNLIPWIYLSLPLHNHQFSSVQFSRSLISDSLRLHGLQHAKPPCPSLTPTVYSNSYPSSQWCHATLLSSVVPFSSAFNLSQHQGL